MIGVDGKQHKLDIKLLIALFQLTFIARTCAASVLLLRILSGFLWAADVASDLLYPLQGFHFDPAAVA